MRPVRPVCLAGQRMAKRHQLAHVAQCPRCSQTAINRAALGIRHPLLVAIGDTLPTSHAADVMRATAASPVPPAPKLTADVQRLVIAEHHKAVAPLSAPRPVSLSDNPDGLSTVALAAPTHGPPPPRRRPTRAYRLTVQRRARTLLASPVAPPTGCPVVESLTRT